MIKTLNKLVLEIAFLNIISELYDKFISNLILNGEKLGASPLRSEWRQRFPLWPLLFRTVLEFLVRSIKQYIHTYIYTWHNKKGILWNYLFSDDMTLCLENSTDSTHTKRTTVKLLILINEFSMFAWYKINIQNIICIFINCNWSLRNLIIV